MDGWSEEEEHYALLASGIYVSERGGTEKYGAYRKRLIEFWVGEFDRLVQTSQGGVVCRPDHIYSEILPVTTGSAAQRILGLTVSTVIQAVALQEGIPYQEVGATTVKKRVAGSGTATKVKIRDAVIALFPELEVRKRELTVAADETDAIAIALFGCGYGQK